MLLPAGEVQGCVALFVHKVGALWVRTEKDGDVVVSTGQSGTVEGSVPVMGVGLTDDS